MLYCPRVRKPSERNVGSQSFLCKRSRERGLPCSSVNTKSRLPVLMERRFKRVSVAKIAGS